MTAENDPVTGGFREAFHNRNFVGIPSLHPLFVEIMQDYRMDIAVSTNIFFTCPIVFELSPLFGNGFLVLVLYFHAEPTNSDCVLGIAGQPPYPVQYGWFCGC